MNINKCFFSQELPIRQINKTICIIPFALCNRLNILLGSFLIICHILSHTYKYNYGSYHSYSRSYNCNYTLRESGRLFIGRLLTRNLTCKLCLLYRLLTKSLLWLNWHTFLYRCYFWLYWCTPLYRCYFRLYWCTLLYRCFLRLCCYTLLYRCFLWLCCYAFLHWCLLRHIYH